MIRTNKHYIKFSNRTYNRIISLFKFNNDLLIIFICIEKSQKYFMLYFFKASVIILFFDQLVYLSSFYRNRNKTLPFSFKLQIYVHWKHTMNIIGPWGSTNYHRKRDAMWDSKKKKNEKLGVFKYMMLLALQITDKKCK